MSTVVVRNGDTVLKDPADSKVYLFDWDTDNLATGVTISTSVWSVLEKTDPTTSLITAISSITRSTTTATVTTSAAHGYATGDSVTIYGATAAAGAISQFNGTFTITVTAATTFTYAVADSGATSASGTLYAVTGIDQTSIPSAAPYSSRYTKFRFTGGELGAVYEISNLILTSESPAQRKERSFKIQIEQL